MIVREFGNEEKQMRREQITNWVAPPEWRTWMEQPIWEEKLFSLGRYLRAKFLYSTMPADGSIWKILRPSRPIGMCVYLAKLHSLTSVTAFGLTFLLMDRSDEYQLVAFILKFKAFQFLSFGLYPALVLGMGVMPCLMALDEGDSSSDVASAADYCLETARGTSLLAMITELVRIALIWSAAHRLNKGAYGGLAELRALEYVRLDAYDGDLDGVKTSREGDWTSRHISTQEYDEHVSMQRDAHGAERQSGGLLPTFLMVDACILVSIVLFYSGMIVTNGISPEQEVFWVILANAKMAWALASLPFFVFSIPILGAALTGARPTGYNERGRLVSMLSRGQKRAKYKREIEQREKTRRLAAAEAGWFSWLVLSPATTLGTGVAAGVSGAMGTASGIASSATEMASSIASSAAGTVGDIATGAVGTASGIASSAVGTVGDIATNAVGTASGIATIAAGTASGIASSAAETASDIASSAVGTASSIASRAAGTASALGTSTDAAATSIQAAMRRRLGMLTAKRRRAESIEEQPGAGTAAAVETSTVEADLNA